MGIARRLFFVPFLVVGVAQLVWCISESQQAIASSQWPTTEGQIIAALVVESHEGRGTAYLPRVTYSYAVDGTSYTGTEIYFGTTGGVGELPHQAERTIQQFPVRSRVAVYYQPERPDHSVLRPGLYWYSYAWFGLSLLGILVGACGVFWPGKRKAVHDVA
jgi:hypothetical protein